MKVVLVTLFMVSACARRATILSGAYTFPDALDPRAITDHAGEDVEFTDGRFIIRRDGEMRVQGRYRAQADTLALTDEGGGVWACTEPDARTTTYSVARRGDTVALHPVARDPCERLGTAGADLLLVPGRAPLAERAEVPAELQPSWEGMWHAADFASDAWADRVFARDATVEFLGSGFVGIGQIKGGWLRPMAAAKNVEMIPFGWTVSANQIGETGRTRVTFPGPSGQVIVRVGRYRATWHRMDDGSWKVARLEMPRLPGGRRGR